LWDNGLADSVFSSITTDTLFIGLDTIINNVVADYDTTGFRLTESQISDLGSYLTTEIDPIYANDSASIIWFGDTTTIIATKYDIDTLTFLRSVDLSDYIEYLDTSLLIGTKYDIDTLSFLRSYTETDPVFTSWDKDYFDLSNLPDFQDSISTYQTDSQTLSIDSVNRVFEIEISDGNSIKFKDTNTEYDLSGIRDTLILHSDSLVLAFDSLVIHRNNINALYDTASIHLDTLQAHNTRILAVENFEETDPVYANDSADITWWGDTILLIEKLYRN